MKKYIILLLMLLPLFLFGQQITIVNSNPGVKIIKNSSPGRMTIENCPVTSGSFISTWTTNLAGGTSTDYQIKLPLESTGTYDFVVDWGDGVCETITSYNQSEVTHSYDSIGTYDVGITGIISGWRFGNTNDKTKIIDISQWGCLSTGNNGSYFYGCINLCVSAIDIINTSGVSTMSRMFDKCESMTTIDVSNWDVSNVTNISRMFSGCNDLNTLDISSWDTGNVADMSLMFSSCTSLAVLDVSSWDTGNVTDISYMFYNTDTLLTGSYSKIQYWDITSILSGTGMLGICTNSMSTVDYNAVLIAWEAQAVKDNVSINFNNAISSGAGTTAKEALANDHGWTITDGGEL